MTPDFLLIDFGSIVVINPISENAKQWTEEHLPEDRQRWGQCGTVVEPRYVDDIIDGIVNESMTIAS